VQIRLVSLTLFNERVLFSTTRVHLFSWNGRKAALRASRNGIILAGDKGYENMLLYLQPHAPDGDEFKVFNGKTTNSRGYALNHGPNVAVQKTATLDS